MKVEIVGDSEWEDLPEVDSNSARASRTPSVPPSPGIARMATRKRKPGQKKAPSSRRSATLAMPIREETPALVDREQVQQAMISGASSTVSYTVDVLSTAFWLLKKPLGVLAFVAALGILSGYVVDKFRPVFAPLCIIPGISSSVLCVRHAPAVPPTQGKKPKSANFTRLVELEDSFQGIMNANVGAGELSLKLKESEMATRDLVTLVRVSELKSRELLADTLTQFVQDAKKTGEGLHTLNAKINGAVDRINAVNDYAMRMIEAASNKGSFSLSRIMPTFGSSTEAVILRSFSDAMDTLAQETQRALLYASASVADLERLQEHLLTIHEICSREGIALGEAHAELLSELWTFLGGNRRTLRRNEAHRELLKALGRYRKDALAHVVVTRDVLQAVAADVEELRERAAAPEIVGDRVPPAVHIRSISSGLERLKGDQQRASQRHHALMNNALAAAGGALAIDD